MAHMAGRTKLPHLTPEQVVNLQDALLENANRLLEAAVAALDRGDPALARALAILGMEESGKAIALHDRRVAMAWRPEGEPFVSESLRNLWSSHHRKLETVHQFLVNEDYWFDTQPPDTEANETALGTVADWAHNHNAFKQRGFYVDASTDGDPITPSDAADAAAVRAAIAHLHQIGWQLRLGEHIEGKRRAETERGIPAATEDAIEDMRSMLRSADPKFAQQLLESMRVGTPGKQLNNAPYAIRLPSNPFANVGRPGYEAHDRQMFALMDSLDEGGNDAGSVEPDVG